MKVVQYQRKPDIGHHSLESCFAQIRRSMALIDGLEVKLEVLPYLSRGLMQRLSNMSYAMRQQGDVSHVTGDVHYIALAMSRKRTLLSVQDCETVRRRRGLSRFLIWLLWYQLPCMWAGRITTISEFTRQDLLSLVKCDPKKVSVVYDLISDVFKPEPKAFNAEYPRVLQIGTAHNKNIPLLIEALSGVKCHLRIIGRLRDDQKAALSKHNMDYSNDFNLTEEAIVREYEAADMVAFASTYEGFGMPILEAQAVGRPIVTSRLCSMPEIGGEAACYVDPYDVSSIRAGLLRVMQDADYRESLVRQGAENVKRFSPDAIAKQYAQIYQEMYEHSR